MALSFIFTVPLLLFLFIGISFEMEPKRNEKNEPAKDVTMKKAGFSDDQKLELKKYFNRTKYPMKNEKIALAGKLNLTWKQVEYWFSNKRQREKIRKRDSGGNASQSATDTDFTLQKGAFSDDKILVLEAFYKRNRYPSRDEKIKIVDQVTLTYVQVEKWFQHRRQKEKKGKRDSGGNANQSATCDTDSTMKTAGLSDDQKLELEKYFNRTKYPSKNEKIKLAAKLNLPWKQVVNWFQHKRTKENKAKRDSGGNVTACDTGLSYKSGSRLKLCQRKKLEKELKKINERPNLERRTKLAARPDMHMKQVRKSIWYKNKKKKATGKSGGNVGQPTAKRAAAKKRPASKSNPTLSRIKSAKKRKSENPKKQMTGKKKAKTEISPNVDNECAREKSVGKSVEESGGYSAGVVIVSDPSRFGYTVINARCENCKSIIQDLIKEYRIQTTALDLLFYTSSWINFCKHYDEWSKQDVCLGMHEAFIDTIYQQMPYTKAGDKTGHSQILCEGINYCPF